MSLQCFNKSYCFGFDLQFNIKAGIPGNQLEIALESEAASIYCQLMHLDEIQKDNTTTGFIRGPGVKYMVVDLGGMFISTIKCSLW